MGFDIVINQNLQKVKAIEQNIYIKIFFDEKNQRRVKYYFGLEVDSFTKVYCLGNKNIDKNVHGPE